MIAPQMEPVAVANILAAVLVTGRTAVAAVVAIRKMIDVIGMVAALADERLVAGKEPVADNSVGGTMFEIVHESAQGTAAAAGRAPH